jgi:putative transposase
VRKAVAKPHRRVANRRNNHVHQVTAKLIRDLLIFTEELSIKTVTASAKGTVVSPGKTSNKKLG